ncbi:hypothetical protein RchiOBHm_Chr1g0360121 [Rosa chinensis]|uniref:Uncharacterized protein n=1 Tax=Rosa chinensis TaxID=74649 RepID=A0A2P6SIL6_ROSCH|nr:hypothetical protein RchiOBHm_Chr1g0360121 [Rosa chinensis]
MLFPPSIHLFTFSIYLKVRNFIYRTLRLSQMLFPPSIHLFTHPPFYISYLPDCDLYTL